MISRTGYVCVHIADKCVVTSGMIACACGMSEWLNVNVFAGEWMSEWSADGMNVIVLHELRAT